MDSDNSATTTELNTLYNDNESIIMCPHIPRILNFEWYIIFEEDPKKKNEKKLEKYGFK